MNFEIVSYLNARLFPFSVPFFCFSDSLGFGLRRRNRDTKFYPRLFRDMPLEPGVPLYFAFGYRGVWSSLMFRFQSAVVLEPGPRSQITLSLKNAARYALLRARGNSLLRDTASLAGKASTSDFDRLLLAPCFQALTTRGLGLAPIAEELELLLFPLTRGCKAGVFEGLKDLWREMGNLPFGERRTYRSSLGDKLKLIERHSPSRLGNELVRQIFYNLLAFIE